MNTILTNIGEQLASNGFITGIMPKISKVWFGDGGGSIITPTKDTTQLVNKITEGVGTTILRLGEPNRLYIYTQIPNNIGDFTVREIGLLTDDDILIAYGGGFEQYKPPLNVSSDRFDYYITIPLSSTQDITINFTNDNEYAPQESVDVVQNGLEARRLEIVDINNKMPNKIEYSDIVDNVVTSNSNKPLSAKQGKILKDLVDTKQNIIQDNTLAINKLNISGGTEINAALVDGDTFIVDDGNNNTVRKSLISRIWTYINSKLTGAISTVVTSNLTASRVVVSDSSGKIGVSGVTATELGYLSGTSSSVQTQLNGKAATNQTMHIGTTAVAINRASASLALTGISIDGNAATVTNGVYTTGNQTIEGVKTFSSTISGSVTGNAGTATKLATARTIGGVSFDGSANINLPGVNITGNQNTTGNAATVTNGVYTTGDQTIAGTKTFNSTITGNISGNSATATKLATARTIALSGGATGTATSFDGTGNISIPVTGLNASNLNSGTVPDARLSGIYSGMSLKLNGNNTVFTTESSGSANISRTVYGLAEYKNNGSATTGAIVFIAPSSPNAVMHQLEVSGLLYNQNIVSLIVQGYRSSDTGAWSDLRKISTGTVDIQVRWGATPDGKNCLILGDVGTVWPYPHIAITRAMFSHDGVSDAYCIGWTVALVTSFTGYSNISATIGDSTMIGNVSSATKLATARTIALSGGATGTATSFDGTGNISIPVTGLNASNLNSGTVPDARISGSYTGMTNLTGTGTVDFSKFLGNGADTVTAPSFSWTGDTNTGIYRPGDDQLAITTGGVQRALFSSSGITGTLVGNASTATKLATARTITLSGDVSGNTSFDGSGNVTLVATVANDSHTHAFTNLTNKPTSLQGYGINPEELPASINLDTKTITGLYSQSSNSETSLALNYPVALAGLLEVFAYSSMIHQRYWVYNSDDVYYRAKYNTGAWTPWTKGANVDDTVAAATKLATARLIGGVSFDGTADITLPGVNAAGNQNTSGNAGSATKLATARTINGVAFDGTANITTANWGTARTITIGATGKSVDGSGNVSWAHTEIGVATATDNTLALRDSSGDITARLFRSEYDTTNADIGFIMTQVNTASNNYIRPSTPAQVALAIGAITKASAQALHATDPLRISGNTLYLYSGNGTYDYVTLPDQITASSNAANGYIKFDNGLIIQWGLRTTAGTSTITFPIAFPTQCFCVNGGLYNGNGVIRCNSWTTTNFKLSNAIYADSAGTWVAFGY